MSDTSLPAIIRFDTTANRMAFTPDPGSPEQLYIWLDSDDEPNAYYWDGAAWQLLNGGSSPGVMSPVVFKPQDNEPLSTNFATLDTRNFHPVLDFDAATDESAQFSGFLPSNYAGGGLTITCFWTAATATSGDLVVDVAIERDDLGGIDIDSDSFATAVSDTSTAPGTSGQIFVTTHIFTSGAAMDGLLAGELFRVRVIRDANAGGDTMTGDAELLRVVVEET